MRFGLLSTLTLGRNAALDDARGLGRSGNACGNGVGHAGKLGRPRLLLSRSPLPVSIWRPLLQSPGLRPWPLALLLRRFGREHILPLQFLSDNAFA